MKAITVQQPYAHLIGRGEKFVENRTWGTGYRGWLGIHAGKGKDYLCPGDEQEFPDMVFGALVGVAQLSFCCPIRQLHTLIRDHPRFGWLAGDRHVEGPVCWIFFSVQQFDTPIAMSGERGLWEVPDQYHRRIVGAKVTWHLPFPEA